MSEPIVKTVKLVKSFVVGKDPYEAVRGIDLEINEGDFAIIYGPSGSGKSTLLNCLIGLESPTSGQIWLDGERIDKLEEDQRSLVRSKKIGVVYQQPIWVKSLSVLENVALPLLISGVKTSIAFKRAKKLLCEVAMQNLAHHKPTEISGGQQQKVSLARALIHNPRILVLDEPTGNLDTHSSDEVMQLLQELNSKLNTTIVMVTHNLIYLPIANRTIVVKDGLLDKNEIKG
jgi:putative ABC transport system ATP-binding protein